MVRLTFNLNITRKNWRLPTRFIKKYFELNLNIFHIKKIAIVKFILLESQDKKSIHNVLNLNDNKRFTR